MLILQNNKQTDFFWLVAMLPLGNGRVHVLSGRTKRDQKVQMLFRKILPVEEAELRYEQQVRIAKAAGFSEYKRKMVAKLRESMP